MPKSAKQKVDDYRARMRAVGLRPIQIWVPDTRAPELVEEARRQSRLADQSADEQEVMALIERAAAEWWPES